MAPQWLLKEYQLADMRRKELLAEAARAQLIAAHPPTPVETSAPPTRRERQPLQTLLRLVTRFKAPAPAR